MVLSRVLPGKLLLFEPLSTCYWTFCALLWTDGLQRPPQPPCRLAMIGPTYHLFHLERCGIGYSPCLDVFDCPAQASSVTLHDMCPIFRRNGPLPLG